MPVTMDEVRGALLPEEIDYPGAARKLGAEALPHLEKIITGDHAGLAAKAAYLAGLIGTDECMPAMQKAARSAQPAVRIAAAAAARNLTAEHNESMLMQLVDDIDPGVQKVALRSAPAQMSESLRARVQSVQESLAVESMKPAAKRKAAPAKKAAKKSKGGKKK